MRRLLFALAAAAVVTAAVAVIAQPEREPLRQDEKRFEVHVTPEMRRHSRISETLFFGGQAYEIAALFVLLATGLSSRMRDFARRVVRRRFVASMLYLVLFGVAMALIDFPLTYYGSYVVPHQFQLTNQSFASWLLDQSKAFGVSLVVFVPLGALALWAISTFKRWWVVLWIASVPLSLFFVVIAPILLDPIFNTFTPLKDKSLETALLQEASTAGIEGSRVYEVDKSKQTKTMNAYVTGLGPTKRIVMWDTLLQKLDRDEILAVMGHEMGHYVMNHLWKGLGFSVIVTLIGFSVAQRVHDRSVWRWGTPGDPATVPWLLIIATVIGFLLTPVTAAFSRHVEHQADVFSLDMTHLNEPMASAFKKFAEDSKYDPDPPRFVVLWYYSHPPTNERIRFALHYRTAKP